MRMRPPTPFLSTRSRVVRTGGPRRLRHDVRALALTLAALGLVALPAGCKRSKSGGDEDTGGGAGKGATATPEKSEAKLHGVDMDKKVVSIGMLNDESGPGAAIGKPYANGKRLLAKRINAGKSGLLPDGWTVKLIERDHAYNPQKSVQAYNEIKWDVLFLGTSFGTPNTLPLRKHLERDKLIAFPASLSSQMAEHPNTPPAAPSYVVEAQRAMDWAVEHAGGADKVKAGIVYQKDDYGKDGLEGWKAQAALHGVEIVAEQTVEPGQQDVTAVVSALMSAGANYVLMTTLPSSTGPVLGTAAQLSYRPTWIGNTPAWIDRFFSKDVVPPAIFASFYWVTGLPFWGEEVPGMSDFLEAWKTYGGDLGEKDSYILMSYMAGLVQIEALRLSIEAGDLSREGYSQALRSMKAFDAGGLFQAIDFSQTPYVTGLNTRILQPVMDQATWKTVADYTAPRASK